MTLDHILAAIEEEAAAEIARLERDSLRKATAILQQAREEAGKLESKIADSRNAELETDAAHLRNQARVDASKLVMQAREAVFERSCQEARTQLAQLRDQESYHKLFRALLDEAWMALPETATSGVIVRVDPRDADLAAEHCREQAKARPVQVEPVLQTWGGLEVTAAGGQVSVHNTLEARLARAEPYLRRLVAEAIPAMIDTPGEGRIPGGA